jgi:hypothetical protein
MPLSRCESCGRRAKLSRGTDDDTRCEFCGGRLRPVWGLAQIAQRTRADRGAGSPQLHESQVREALYGRPGQAPPGHQDGADGEPAGGEDAGGGPEGERA